MAESLADRALTSARRTLAIEAAAVSALSGRVGQDFVQAISYILDSQARVIVCGMGKSGIIAHKMAATLMSTGTPSFYMHPGEAYHGDLGMVARGDVVIAISNSGETDEVVKLLPFLKANDNYLIAMTANRDSTLGAAADCWIDVGVESEACPLQLAPTSSTTAALAMGDAIAIAVMDARGFGPEDFARFHPGGSLGRRLLSRVEDEMVPYGRPAMSPSASFIEVVSSITGSNLGLILVGLPDGWAIITDGDVRRAIEKNESDVFGLTAADIMTPRPATVSVGARSQDAFEKMDRLKVTSLLVMNGDELCGIIKK